jgi:hypothetical protein
MGAFESHGGAICAPLSASPERHGRRSSCGARRRVGADLVFWRAACLALLMRAFDSHDRPICATRSAAASSRPTATNRSSARTARAGLGALLVGPTALVSAQCSSEPLCRRVRQGATRCARAAASRSENTHQRKIDLFFFSCWSLLLSLFSFFCAS